MLDMIHFNDLYIHVDDGSLWNDTTFKATYNHYKWDLDEDWSKPYEKWKEWFINGANGKPFLTLEQFLKNKWFEIEDSIKENHPNYLDFFQDGQSKSEIFLSFVYMFSDLDHYFENNLYLDIDDIRAQSPIQSQEDTETLRKIEENYLEDYNDIDSDEFEI